MSAQTLSVSGLLAVLIASVLWGTTGVAATFAPGVSASAIGAVAMGGGGLLQAVVAARALKRNRGVLFAQWPWVVAGAIAVAIYPLAFYASMRIAGVTVGTVVSIGSAPLFSAFIELLLDGTRVRPRWLVGAALGIFGIVLLSIAQSVAHMHALAASGAGAGYPLDGLHGSVVGQQHAANAVAPQGWGLLSSLSGIGLGLVAGFTYAFYSWAAHRLIHRGIVQRAVMGSIFGVGGLILVPVLLATGAPLLASWQNAAVGLYMMAVPMFIGYVCFGFGLARISASAATTITLLEPVVAAVLAAWVAGERLSGLGLVGVLLILLCLVIVSLPHRREPDAVSEAGVL